MKSAAFEYMCFSGVKDTLLGQKKSNLYSKFLGGSQSIGPMLNLRLAQPECLIDIKSIPELKKSSLTSSHLELGSCITHAMIEDGLTPDVTSGMMKYVAKSIAYRAIRNQGTIGGSLCHADPAADWVSTMMLLDAELDLIRSNDVTGELEIRRVRMSDFMTGPFSTVLNEDELLIKISVPIYSPEMKWGYYKICQKPGEFSQATCAVLHDPKFSVYRLVIGATQSTPILIKDAKKAIDEQSVENLDKLLNLSLSADEFEISRYKVAIKRSIEMLNTNKQS